MQFRTAYGPRVSVPLEFPEGEGRTKQSFKDECDVNQIMARFQRTGVLEFRNKFEAQYADVSGVTFQAAMDTIARANHMFHSMPARVRDKFQNDPGRFLAWIQNPNHADEARELGLMKPKESAPVVEPAAAPAAASAAASAPAGGGKGGEAPK